MPLLSVVVLWLPGQRHGSGSMRLAIGWLHEAGDPPHPTLRGGSMTLAIRWLHEGGETLGTWLHEAGDWHPRGRVRGPTARDILIGSIPGRRGAGIALAHGKTRADAVCPTLRERAKGRAPASPLTLARH